MIIYVVGNVISEFRVLKFNIMYVTTDKEKAIKFVKSYMISRQLAGVVGPEGLEIRPFVPDVDYLNFNWDGYLYGNKKVMQNPLYDLMKKHD